MMRTSIQLSRQSGISRQTVPDKDREEMHHIYSGWAMYFFIRDPEKTEYCFSKCLELNPGDANSLYLRSVSKRNVARFESALEDALGAATFRINKPQYDFEVCENYNQLKHFETCKAELHNKLRKYAGVNARKFIYSLDVIDQHLEACLGPALALFVRKHKQQFPKVLENINRERAHDPRPRWKILKEESKCDVVSIDEKQKLLISPLEKARRERWYRIFSQIYFGRNWIDKAFMRDLVKNDKYLSPIFSESTPLLTEVLQMQNEAVKKFVKILHARSPLYVELNKRFGNQKFAKRHTEGYLFQQGYQTRRKLFNVLRTIKGFREKKNIEGMSKYIEDVMGNYVTTKTNRIMPLKFEFLNDVYNTLALTHADWYIKSDQSQLFKLHRKFRLQRMFGLEVEAKQKSGFVFGDRSTYVPADAVDPSLLVYKKFLERLEKRLHFAKYPIEIAYLWHEIARAHLKRNHYKECETAAKRAVEAAKLCNSNIWAFISQMLIAKSFAAQHKIENCHNALKEAHVAAKLLKNSNLLSFIEMAAEITDEEIATKQSNSSIEHIRRKTYGSTISHTLSNVNSNLI